MQWPLWPFLRYFVDVSVHNDGDWLHLAYLKRTWYVPHAISQYYCNGVLKIKSANQKRSKIFKDENTLFQKRKNVEAHCYMMWHSTFSQNSKISCFVPTCSITPFFFFKVTITWNLAIWMSASSCRRNIWLSINTPMTVFNTILLQLLYCCLLRQAAHLYCRSLSYG